MWSLKLGNLVNRALRDITGSVLVEAAVVMPLFLVVALGTVDATNLFHEYQMADKAAYYGARVAAVSNPVASTVASYLNLTNPPYTAAQLANASCDTSGSCGGWCFSAATGNTTGNCPSGLSYTCQAGSCTNSGSYSSTAFTPILTAMQSVYPQLQAANVKIVYTQIDNSGFAGNLSWNVTVSILPTQTHQFYFISGLINLLGGRVAASSNIPAYASTLTAESLGNIP
jgi:Flp pilus assembly protein TadG